MDTVPSFGERLRATRLQRQVKATHLAKQLGISLPYLSQLESGRAVPSEALARKVARFLGQDEEQVLLLARRIPERVGNLLQRFPKLASKLEEQTATVQSKLQPKRRHAVVQLIAGSKNAEEILNAVRSSEQERSAGQSGPPTEQRLSLADTFDAVRPSVIAFASRIAPTRQGEAPILPEIIGTGFLIDSRGIAVTNKHVVEALQNLLPHPRTGTTSAMAILTPGGERTGDGVAFPVLFVDIKAYSAISSFTSNAPYYGEALPDIAFVQLKVRDVPALPLVTEPNAIRIGTFVATAGFPLGTDALVAFGAVNQLTPFLRRGIISSVYPFPCPNPHGFTIDIMSQGGASGSPVFLTDSPQVLGMVHAGMHELHSDQATRITIAQTTNVTMALPALLISQAFDACTNGRPLDFSDVPTLDTLLKESPRSEELRWESFSARRPNRA